MTKPDQPELFHWGEDDQLPRPVFLYAVRCGDGADYWMIAYNALDAVAVLLDAMNDDGFEDPDDWREGFEVSEVSADEAAGLTFWTDDGNTDFVSEFNRDPSRRVMACSEWEP